MTFKIEDFVSFDAKGRAPCPSCALDGKTSQKNLSRLESGAFKCHRGCTSVQIRGALGEEQKTAPPPQTQTAVPAAKVLVSPQKIKESNERLLQGSPEALTWLIQRGIDPDMIRRHRLGIVRSRVGDSSKPGKFCHLQSISIPIPNADGTAYFQKKRVAPWLPEEERPDGYQAWSQYGIPQMVFITHAPPSPKQTWLCEGEWDAIALAAVVRESEFKDTVQVACFTCGAGNVPPEAELDRLVGEVIVFYDLDEPGAKGAAKVAARLKSRCRVAAVPAAVPEPPPGWDISDALTAGLFAEIVAAAAAAPPWQAPPSKNPLRDRLITNDELLARAPDFTDWLIDDILTADELFLLAAPPRAGKSLLVMGLAKAVATGGRFLGRPAASGAVIYVACEDSETKIKERELKQDWPPGVPVYWIDKFKLNELPNLEELIEELGCRLLVLDTLSRIKDSQINESSAEMSQLLEPLQEMCKRQRCTGVLVHHTGKINAANAGEVDIFDTIRGSSSIRATCRGSLVLAADERNYRLCVENGWGKLDMQVLLDAHTLEWRLLGNWMGPNVDLNQKDRVLAYLNQVAAASIDKIAEATNLPKKSLYEVLKRLQADDLIEKRGERLQAVYVRSGASQMALLESALDLDEGGGEAIQHDQPGDQKVITLDPKKPIQHIQRVELLLNDSNADGDGVRGSIQQNTFCAPPPEKVITQEKSDQKNDHFFENAIPPTPGDFVELEPKPLPAKGLRIQQQFNTDSTRVSKSDQLWVYCTEIETSVRLDKQGRTASTCYVPGVGSRQFNNDLLQPLEAPAVELEGEHVE